jgi:hypothetical protein
MTSTFDALMADHVVPGHFDHFGDADSITYTPAVGDAVTLSAILGPETTKEGEDLNGRTREIVRDATIHTDPDSKWGGVAAPALNATVTNDSVEYAIDSIGPKTPNWITLELKRKSKKEVTRRGYRE